MTLSIILIRAKAEEWSGSAFCRSNKESIYLNHNLCVKCKLQYPKDSIQCVICKKPLRTKSKKKRSTHYEYGVVA